MLDNPGADGRLSWNLQTGNPVLDAEIRQLSLDASDVDAMTKTYGESIEKAIPAIVDDLASLMLKRIKRDAPGGLLARDTQRMEFERRLLHRWRKPLALFALEIELAVEIGGSANERLRRRRRPKSAHVIEAATRIHARACQVAGEVEALSRSGFADGALARWRTLHELTVVCWFLVEHGQTVAERYLLHLDIDSLRAAEQYSEFAPLLGYRPIPQRQLDRLKRRRTQLIKRFGKDFSNEYGWASGALRNPKPNFSDIEKAVKLSRMRPYYKLASGNVHAGPKGAFFRIGMLATGPQVLLVGASNAGLDEAGRLAAISLAQITVALLQIKPTLDSAISARILIEVSNDAETEFIKVQRALRREDLARQNKQAKKKPVGKAKKR